MRSDIVSKLGLQALRSIRSCAALVRLAPYTELNATTPGLACAGGDGYLHPSIHPDFNGGTEGNTAVWYNSELAPTAGEEICNFGAANLTKPDQFCKSLPHWVPAVLPLALSSDPSDQLDDAGRCWPVRPSPPTNPPTTSQPTATPAPTTQYLDGNPNGTLVDLERHFGRFGDDCAVRSIGS